MDTIFPTTRKLKRMFTIILSIVVIVAMALSGIWVPAKAAFAGDNGKIAFMTNRDSNFEIYVMDSDGANQTNLTNNPAYDGHPSWSPDGSQIAFASERDGNYEIYVMNADGSDPIRLTTTASTDAFPSWSPDGSQIVFTSYDFSLHNYDIWRMNSDGTGAVKLTDNPTEDTEPVWSPDGTKIAFRSDRDGNMEIYAMNPDGSDQTNLTNHADADGEPNWSPDGSRIAFASVRDGFTGAIWVMNADGSEPTRLTDAVYGDGDPAWSPDGTRIVFKGFRHYNDEIYVMNADGTDITRLTNNALPGNTLPEDWMPDWQPISFVANPYIVASEAGNWFWTTDFKPGTLSLYIYESADEGATLLWDGTGEADETGFLFVDYESHSQDLVPGNYLVVSDGDTQKGLVLELITMEVFDTDTEIMAGTAPPGRDVWAMAGPQDWQQPMTVNADPDTGAWLADFKTLAEPFDITEEMRPWSYAHIYDEDGDANEAGAPPPPPPPLNPHFTVFPEWEWFDGWDWPDGATVSINVAGKPECTTTKESWEYFFNGGFPEGCDVAIGDTVTFTDGETIRTHTVWNLTVSNVNLAEDIVSGTADAGEVVYVWPHATGQQLQAPVEEAGTWQVDFTGVFDLVEGTDGRSEIRDEQGNATAVDWRIPNPHITAFPEWESIEGWEWPAGAVVHLTIEDPATSQSPDYSGDEPVGPTPWDPNQLWVQFNFANAYDMKPGDIVTLDDGVTTRTHTVRNLAITAVDEAANTVAGTAEGGETIHVWPHATGQQLRVTADVAGIWLADFSGVFDLVKGEGGRSEVRDELGNSTAVDWWVPNPRFVVFPEWEWFDGLDWPNGATVTITVDGKPECTTAQGSSGFFFNGSFGEGCDVVFGDEVTFTDGETLLTHTVQNLAITNVDIVANTVSGKADAGAVVQVWPHETGEQLQPTAGDAGLWQVDFTGLFDLVEGTCGRSQIVVGDNATAVDWCAPRPWLIVFPKYEAVEGWEWPDGATIALTIDNAPGLVWEGVSAVTTWGDPRTYVRFDFWEQYDLQAGDLVTLTDGTTVRTHTVQNLLVSDVSADADTVSGTADAGAVVRVWPHGHDQTATLQITTAADGTWAADFAGVGFNLVPGIGGRSEVGDEAGNKTAVDWGVPMPGWEQVNVNGFGDPLTRGVSSLEVFLGQIYAGASNWETGGQVWRLGADGQWLKVVDAGFGSGAANRAVIDLAVFKGQLYSGTGWNTEAPGQVWRSSDGMNWQPVTTDGFGDANNIAVTNFVAFKGMLYAGTGSANGSAQIWRSTTGRTGTWTQVAPDGSGLAGNVTGFAVYKGALYASIEPADGFGGPIQVWRSTNGSHWVTVTADGFGDARNESTGGFAQFGGYLYLGTRNEETGAQLWRTGDGIHWEMVVGDGFGDLNNIKIESLFVYDNLLHAATYNPSMGLQLWHSADGIHWEQVTANGFGDSNNFSTLWNSATINYQGRLLIGTWNDAEGGELWRFTP